ncbi:MAG: DUF2071 domain-containing protein [Acidobacteria bacterium]|nr:DUF2071 domain-containing protein [Acidobacteriota bacterium]
MLPTLEGTIARRVLLSFRADPLVVRRLIPEPLELLQVDRAAIVGVCLLRLEHLRVKGMPGAMGFTSENAAHRVAVRFPGEHGMEEGVFIWRRKTDSGMLAQLGGRLFPAEFQRASFQVREDGIGLSIEVATEHSTADVSLLARFNDDGWSSSIFPDFSAAKEFFRRGECAFSCTGHASILEGVRLHASRWEMSPLEAVAVRAHFFEQPEYFPRGSVEFDSALLMRGIPHEWHALENVPELAAAR